MLNSSHKHRDIAGRELAVDNHVILCEHNRIIVGKIVKLHDNWGTSVTVQPLNSDAGGRRQEPTQKPVRRNSYNLYLVTEPEMILAMLRGAV